jgi:hypothetical protein
MWCLSIYYRGYILIRLKIIDTQWKIIEKINTFQSTQSHKSWDITYASPVHGGWDLIIECAFNELNDLNVILDFCRTDKDLIGWIEATTTLISIKKDFVL